MEHLENMKDVFILSHPLIQHKISRLRDVNTGTNEFRKLIEEIAMLMGYEALGDLPTEEVEIETPIAWEGRTVLEVDVRRKYNVNILGVKSGDEIVPLLNPEYRFQPDAHLIVAGDKEAGIRLMNLH